MSRPPGHWVVDGRFLEPPEPFVRTMAMLDALPQGERMLLQLYREPHPLYRVLDDQGYRRETRLLADGAFEILIWRESP